MKEGSSEMPGKRFPYRAAYVACRGDGSGKCRFGCIGCKKCADVCPSDAVIIMNGHAALIDRKKCRACGLCAESCPQGIIHLHDDGNRIIVACSNCDPGAAVKKVCEAGCIGCGLCEKSCTASAITVGHFLARICENKCLSCGICAVKCPQNALRDLRGILTD